MALHAKSSGTRVTSSTIDSVTDTPSSDDPLVQVTEDLVQRREFPGGSDAGTASGDDYVTLAFRAGQVVRRSELLAMLSSASIASISPATGPATGGTEVTITGSGLDGVTGVTFDGVAATAVTVVDSETVTCTTPAGTAGPADVVVTDDGGPVTEAGGFTYQ